jgi:prepilin-type N-terminal cleavage/methylation domain-containing protein
MREQLPVVSCQLSAARLAWSHPRGRRGRGFTLIEMMVVIGIILLLVALTVGVTVALASKSESREAESIIKVLDLALTEWESTSERQLTYGAETPTTPYDFDSAQYDADPDKLQSDFLKIMMRNPQVADMLAQIGGDRLRDVDPDPDVRVLRIIDPWDRPIRVLFPGRKWTTGTTEPRDLDGTIRTQSAEQNATTEAKFGSCVNSRICFISSGPDGQDGNLGGTQAQQGQSADNIESYPLIKEAAIP